MRAVVSLFESLSPADLPGLRGVYAADARFKDPFNDVQGLPAIARIFGHLFRQLDDLRFTVRDVVADRDALFLTWDFDFRRRRPGQTPGAGALQIHGASHLRFDADGRVAMHRDYWDSCRGVVRETAGHRHVDALVEAPRRQLSRAGRARCAGQRWRRRRSVKAHRRGLGACRTWGSSAAKRPQRAIFYRLFVP